MTLNTSTNSYGGSITISCPSNGSGDCVITQSYQALGIPVGSSISCRNGAINYYYQSQDQANSCAYISLSGTYTPGGSIGGSLSAHAYNPLMASYYNICISIASGSSWSGVRSNPGPYSSAYQ
jgi:hypothetical protein